VLTKRVTLVSREKRAIKVSRGRLEPRANQVPEVKMEEMARMVHLVCQESWVTLSLSIQL
jgi:hypothetical protein